jgi:RimJ/RimL family protein N-acetyltransferase
MTPDISLRAVTDSDLAIFFENESDPEARHMAAFTSKDPTNREAFLAHWAKIRGDDANVIQTVLFNGQVVGSIGSWPDIDASGEVKREICYWFGRSFWGKGIATRALTAFLRQLPARPLYAHAAKDNLGSIRVLEKCGFTLCGEDMYFSHARGEEIAEVLLKLEASPGV